jgi:cyanophycin synthetase
MREYAAGKEVCLVSTKPDNPVLAAHLKAGGLAACIGPHGPASEIKLCRGAGVIGKMAVADIPATFGGAFEPAVHNALFATAIAYGMGIDFATIRVALEKFQSTLDTNPGRMNFIEGLPYTLLVTWADGREPLGELARFVRGLETAGRKSILLTGMGNRPDSYLLDMSKSASGVFDRYVCSDWTDLRGRPAGVVARVLAQGLSAAGVSADRIAVASSYDQALEQACGGAGAGDLLVILNFNHPNVVKVARALADRSPGRPNDAGRSRS